MFHRNPFFFKAYLGPVCISGFGFGLTLESDYGRLGLATKWEAG